MQGVRTTRGCINCRKRKKGCDFQQPCARCQKLKLSCKYETRQFLFVDADSGPSNASAPIRTSVSQGSLLFTDMTTQIDSRFWAIYHPDGDSSAHTSIDGAETAPWIYTVRTLATDWDHLQTAVQALAFAGCGWMQNDKYLVQQGVRLYTKALRQINKILQDPASAAAQSDAFLASCRILSMFEMYRRLPNSSEPPTRTQTRDWQSHIDGSCRLIQLRGAAKNSSKHGGALYDAARLTAIIFGVARREPNALTSSSSEPYRGRPTTLRDSLLDIMSAIPDLYQRFDSTGAKVRSSPDFDALSRNVDHAIDLLVQFIAISQQLQAWEERVIEACQRMQAPLRAGNPETTSKPTLMEFCVNHGDGFFYTCANYWASCLKIFPTARLLHTQLLSLPESASSSIPGELPASMNPEPAANNLVQTTWYFFRPNAGLMAAQSAVFPVGAALFYFARTGRRDSAVFAKMMDTFASANTGSVMLDFVKDIVDRA